MTAVQFLIPRSVADALPIDEIKPRARAAGLERASLEYNAKDARGQLRVTCSRVMADFLLEQLRALAERPQKGVPDPRWPIDCATAIRALGEAIATSLQRGTATGTEPTPY